VFLEGHVRSAAPGGERVYETLTDEETNGDADCDLDHAQAECKAAVVLLHGAVIVSSETTSLGKARLEGVSGPPLARLRDHRQAEILRGHIPVRGRVHQSPSR